MSAEYQQALGRRIAQKRKRRGLPQPELARMVDRSVAWISQVERGVRKTDRMSVLEKAAQALDVPLSELAAEAPVVAAVAADHAVLGARPVDGGDQTSRRSGMGAGPRGPLCGLLYGAAVQD